MKNHIGVQELRIRYAKSTVAIGNRMYRIKKLSLLMHNLVLLSANIHCLVSRSCCKISMDIPIREPFAVRFL